MGNNATYFGSTEKNYFGLGHYGEHKEGNFQQVIIESGQNMKDYSVLFVHCWILSLMNFL